MTELVIFDCDGVLIDNEPIACRSLAKALNEFGVEISYDEVVELHIGASIKGVIKDIKERYGRDLTPEFWAGHLELFLSSMATELEAIPGIFDVLDTIGLPKCVASSGRMARLKPALEIVGLYDRFAPHVYNAEMVEHAKPAPDLFLYAADQMNVTPGTCIVVEDSKAGVTAAKAAGMYCIGFTGGGHCGPGHADLLKGHGADIVIDDMTQLLPLI